MVSTVRSIGLFGLDGYAVDVETDVSSSENAVTDIIGLPDAAVKEARDRIIAALKNSGIHMPTLHIIINLAPAHMRKEGSTYDLAMLLGVLSAMGGIPQPSQKAAFCGEISLSGKVRPTSGILASVISAKALGFEEIYIPIGNLAEGSVIDGIKVYGVDNFGDLLAHIRGERLLTPAQTDIESVIKKAEEEMKYDFADVVGQQGGKRACELAAAGGHNLLFIGPPGTGKSLLAKCMPSIMPDMTFDEIIETSRIYSVAGKLSADRQLIVKRPLVQVNQGTSIPGLTGGGAIPGPGAISLAQNGILFLDELPEFSTKVVETLRQPMEDGKITITRVKKSLSYPASFTLLCAMNPCPCGNYGNPMKKCVCSPKTVSNYINKISGPLLDRIDLQTELPQVKISDINSGKKAEPSAKIKERVNAAREIQRQRFRGTDIPCNAKMTVDAIRNCGLTHAAEELLNDVFVKRALSMRAYDKLIKIARTSADLEGSADILPKHINEAVYFRSLDKKYWNREV